MKKLFVSCLVLFVGFAAQGCSIGSEEEVAESVESTEDALEREPDRVMLTAGALTRPLLAQEEKDFVVALNAYRARKNLGPLYVSAFGQRAAEAHAADIARTNLPGHTSSDGTEAYDRINRHWPLQFWGWDATPGIEWGEDVAWSTDVNLGAGRDAFQKIRDELRGEVGFGGGVPGRDRPNFDVASYGAIGVAHVFDNARQKHFWVANYAACQSSYYDDVRLTLGTESITGDSSFEALTTSPRIPRPLNTDLGRWYTTGQKITPSTLVSEGQSSLLLSSTQQSGQSAVQIVRAAEGLTYTLSVDTRGLNQGASNGTVQLDFLDDYRDRIGHLTATVPAGDGEWHNLAIRTVSPPKTQYVRISLLAKRLSDGTIDAPAPDVTLQSVYDNVKLEAW